MKATEDQIEAILYRIGYHKARQLQRHTLMPIYLIDATSGLWASSHEESEQLSAQLNQLQDAYAALATTIVDLAPRVRKFIDDAPRTPEEWEGGALRSRVDEALEALLEIKPSIDYVCRLISHERTNVWLKDETKHPNHVAKRIAEDMLEIYYLAHGKKPRADVKPAEIDQPSAKYHRAVRDMLQLLNVQQGWRRACEQAVRGFGGERLERLDVLRARKGQRGMSLATKPPKSL